MEVDSNHRSNLQQIYSLSPLATRESIHEADDRTRTDNLLITNQLLCQLSHIGILVYAYHGLPEIYQESSQTGIFFHSQYSFLNEWGL